LWFSAVFQDVSLPLPEVRKKRGAPILVLVVVPVGPGLVVVKLAGQARQPLPDNLPLLLAQPPGPRIVLDLLVVRQLHAARKHVHDPLLRQPNLVQRSVERL
jgi:hypothetical protein